ncbi:ribonuclease H-like domain-containing protein [Tanacetum coccineum]|uniref:Ribonuclease H-like domain-containing protein n=1 Tax=Tanacetum coccineum TaxID=301880 RepID=A0ABQ5EU32_9ASTR
MSVRGTVNCAVTSEDQCAGCGLLLIVMGEGCAAIDSERVISKVIAATSWESFLTGESCSHSFLSCSMLGFFWRKVAHWWDFDIHEFSSYEEWITLDPTLYRSLAGGLQYLTFTLPDLSYAVQQGTLELGLHLYAFSTTSLVRYTDADWAGFPSTRRSTSNYCVFLGDNLLSWSAKRQHIISRSSAEAEYRGVANVVAETAWIRNLLRKLHSPLLTATLVYCDNVSAVYMSANPVQH